jgi:hypothetical protein
VCAPDATDNPCTACARASCCTELTACEGDLPCECLIECVEGGSSAFDCFDQCGASPATQELAQCAGGACQECL